MKRPKQVPAPRRMSGLPILQHCSRAADLDVGAGRSAAQSSAMHALFAGEGPDGQSPSDMLLRLTQAERDEIAGWHRPTPLDVLGQSLEYDDARKETSLALGADGDMPSKDVKGEWVSPPILTGHPDMLWTVEHEGQRVVVVGDMKRSRFTTPEGTESLQLHAYGIAECVRIAAPYYLPAIWLLEEGRWIVGDLHEADGFSTAGVWAVILDAATRNDASYSTGDHCQRCWSRTRCPAHMVVFGQDELVVPGTVISEELTPAAARELLLLAKRHSATADSAVKYLRAWVDRNGPLESQDGTQQWGPVLVSNPERSLSPAKLREVLGDTAEKLITSGGKYTQYTWRKKK